MKKFRELDEPMNSQERYLIGLNERLDEIISLLTQKAHVAEHGNTPATHVATHEKETHEKEKEEKKKETVATAGTKGSRTVKRNARKAQVKE